MLEMEVADICRPPFKPDVFLKLIKALRLTKKSSSVLRKIAQTLQKYAQSIVR
jgi:hypothetical protein